MIRKVKLKLIYLYYSILNINKLNIGEIVFYRNEKCQIIQLVGYPYMNLLPLDYENLKLDKRIIYKDIHKDNISRKPLYKRMSFSFFHSYGFYMRNYYNTDFANNTIFNKNDKL